MMDYKALVRLLLIVSLVYYFPGGWFFPFTGEKTALASVQAQTESGIGGGAAPESMHIKANLNFDFDFAETFDPEDYSRPRILTFTSHTMQSGDIIGHIAARTGLTEDTLISVNNISNTRRMQIGQVIRIPNQDGIFYSVRAGDTLESIAGRYNTTVSHIKTANQLFSENLTPNDTLFIPGGRLDWVRRQEINGDLFIWPTAGWVTSGYGFRISPFSGRRQFHSGIDIGAPMGSPVRAAMAGRVIRVGYDSTWGNYVMINHHSGFRTFYAHMSAVRVRPGAQVRTGERIGDIGSTGLSTGPHLHFTVFRNGATVNPRTLMR